MRSGGRVGGIIKIIRLEGEARSISFCRKATERVGRLRKKLWNL